jgi:hypothetical protein
MDKQPMTNARLKVDAENPIITPNFPVYDTIKRIAPKWTFCAQGASKSIDV